MALGDVHSPQVAQRNEEEVFVKAIKSLQRLVIDTAK